MPHQLIPPPTPLPFSQVGVPRDVKNYISGSSAGKRFENTTVYGRFISGKTRHDKWVPVTRTWTVHKLRMEETASRYGG